MNTEREGKIGTQQREPAADQRCSDQQRPFFRNASLPMFRLLAFCGRDLWTRGKTRARGTRGWMAYSGRRAVIAMKHGTRAHHRRNRVLEDQLLLAIVLKQDRVLVKRAYFACEFNSADQVYRDRSLIFTDRVEKRVLDVLCRLIVHVPISMTDFVEVR
jgi:hypothetical protein